MVATSLRQPKAFRGILPFDPARDLGAVARLLEEAFREDNAMLFSHLPLARELGILMWTLNYLPAFPENISGFVWAEDGQIVGNLTLTRDEGWTDRYFLSNLAVKRDYRHQGIGRQLMRAAVAELQAHSARWVLLSVRPHNLDAIRLYREFRFEEIETRGDWTKTRARAKRQVVRLDLQPLRWSDRRAAIDLLRAVVPDKVQNLRKQEIRPAWLYLEDRLTEIVGDFLTGQRTRRWALTQNGRMTALVTVHGQSLFSPHRFQIEVHPDLRGQIEDQLVAAAMNELAAFPVRTIRVSGTTTHPELIAALELRGFRMQNGLTLMALGF